MKSFNRLRCLNQAVLGLIEELDLRDVIVADIATDHGYLAELLSRNNRVKKVVATDISQKCLDKTNELKQRCNLNKIETRLGDGLTPIDEVDVSVMAGIGSYEIIKILDKQNHKKNGERKCNLFILQPSKNTIDLRLYLVEKNVEIIKDYIVYSGGRFYPIIVVNLHGKGNTEKTIFNLYFGKSNTIENDDFIKFLNAQLEELKFLEKLNKEDIENSNDLKTKSMIYALAKKLISKSKGE